MTGITIKVDIDERGFKSIHDRIARLAPLNRVLVLDGVGQIVEMQTRRRLQTEKTAPDGSAWPLRWGKRNVTYNFETKKWGYIDFSHPLMVLSGALRNSIHHVVEGSTSVRVGSNLIYAAIHQMGGEIRPVKAKALAFKGAEGDTIVTQLVTIPARPYLGVSKANAVEIERHLVTLLGRRLNG